MTIAPPIAAAQFNVRAYGLWINNRNQVLLTIETIGGRDICKFPGGGLQFGEGLLDCLAREWQEELAITPEVIRHYYTTDFFQSSAFRAQEQVLSVYYLVKSQVDLQSLQSYEANVRLGWFNIQQLEPDQLTLPIDQHVASMLRHDFGQMPSGNESA